MIPMGHTPYNEDNLMPKILRKDFHVRTVDGLNVAIREVRPDGPAERVPILFLHGTRIPGLSEFDLPVENGSLSADMAAKGHVCYILDARGYGKSDRPAEMEEPPKPGERTLVRSIEITRDVDAAVNHLLEVTGKEKVALLGWGVGGSILMMYAAMWPEKISHSMGYMMPYGGVAIHPIIKIGSPHDDPENPGHFNRQTYGNYSINGLEILDEHWNRVIPIEDKDAWRDPAMFVAFRQALIDGDPRSTEHNPPMYRCPNGMMEDLYYMVGLGKPLFNANQIYCKVMIIAAEYDDLCSPEDMEVFIEDLVHAEEVVHWRQPNTTQYVILDRPERGRSALIARMDEFLA